MEDRNPSKKDGLNYGYVCLAPGHSSALGIDAKGELTLWKDWEQTTLPCHETQWRREEYPSCHDPIIEFLDAIERIKKLATTTNKRRNRHRGELTALPREPPFIHLSFLSPLRERERERI